jgi:hypothetical protein
LPFAGDCRASPEGFTQLESPGKQYTLMLVSKVGPNNSESYELRVFRGNRELAHYPYEDVMVNAYWLLPRKLVVLDSRLGIGGYSILVLSLADGSIITGHGPVKSPNYNPAEDDDYLPDLFAEAHSQMKRLYKDVDNDEMRLGYESAAIGWTPVQRIKVFARFPFDHFAVEQGYVFQVDADLEATDQRKLKWRNVSVRKVKCDRSEPKPEEMKRLDNLLMRPAMEHP